MKLSERELRHLVRQLKRWLGAEFFRRDDQPRGDYNRFVKLKLLRKQ
jgi:hypothetical protein